MSAALWFSAIGCGLMAGVYFAFSAFVMSALDQAPQGAAAMNVVNRVILGSAFMPLFWGTTAAGLALAVVGALHLGEPGSAAMLAGGTVYMLGMFAVTILFNVPLNNELTGGDGAVWDRYLTDWTRWNHVRVAASAAAAALFTAALVSLGEP